MTNDGFLQNPTFPEKLPTEINLEVDASGVSGRTPEGDLPVRRFVSRKFPGDEGVARVFGRNLVQPLAACTLPLMILAVVNAMYGHEILSFAFLGLPVALAAATLWTIYQLKAEMVLLWVAGPRAAVVSIWDHLHGQRPVEWQPVLDLRVAHDACYATIGDSRYEIERALWPEFEEIIDALRAARHYGAFAGD